MRFVTSELVWTRPLVYF